jgi:uncharacterized DUF497 family protein
MRMEFEWDEIKSERTRRERGVGFDAAIGIFEGRVVQWEDERRDWGEIRIVAVGVANGRFLTVVYTDRGERRRIISARVSRETERERWRSSERL